MYIFLHLYRTAAYLAELWKEYKLMKSCYEKVAQNKQRKYIKDIAKLWLGKETMSKQAKTLTQQEIRKVLDYIATRPHNARNRAMLMTTFASGMRCGEVASLHYSDVVDADGKIRSEILLSAEQTKGNEARVVFVNERLRKELEQYIRVYKPANPNAKFFYSQKRDSDGFTANTLTQWFYWLYRKAGIHGASSHSGRHTFITNLASKGVGVRVLMSLAGHKNISTTQCYIDVNDDMKRKAVELI
jgi:integrase/recombinase XerD